MNWPTVKLGDVCDSIDYGHTASANVAAVGPKFLRITDIQNNSVNWNTVPYCEIGAKEARKKNLRAGDIVFARTGATTGKSFLIRKCPTETVFASYLIRVRPNLSLQSEYLAHFFQTEHYWRHIAKNATGTAQGGVNASILKELEIPLPPLAEQQRIAARLDAADRLRALRRDAVAALDALTHSLFLEMFGDPIDPNNEREIIKLGEVAEIIMGQSPPGTSYNSKGEGEPLLNGPTEFGLRFPVEKQWTTKPKKFCKADDVLFCVRGATAGKLNMADKPYCLGRGVAAIRGYEISNEFLFALLKRYYAYFQAKGVGSTFINISGQDLKALPIPNATNEEASEFAARLGQIETVRSRMESSRVSLDALFASLQSAAFEGENAR